MVAWWSAFNSLAQFTVTICRGKEPQGVTCTKNKKVKQALLVFCFKHSECFNIESAGAQMWLPKKIHTKNENALSRMSGTFDV